VGETRYAASVVDERDGFLDWEQPLRDRRTSKWTEQAMEGFGPRPGQAASDQKLGQVASAQTDR
jgi:hypothetical protein